MQPTLIPSGGLQSIAETLSMPMHALRSDNNEKQAAFAEFIAIHGRSYASKDHAENKFAVFS